MGNDSKPIEGRYWKVSLLYITKHKHRATMKTFLKLLLCFSVGFLLEKSYESYSSKHSRSIKVTVSCGPDNDGDGYSDCEVHDEALPDDSMDQALSHPSWLDWSRGFELGEDDGSSSGSDSTDGSTEDELRRSFRENSFGAGSGPKCDQGDLSVGINGRKGLTSIRTREVRNGIAAYNECV